MPFFTKLQTFCEKDTGGSEKIWYTWNLTWLIMQLLNFYGGQKGAASQRAYL